MDIDCFILSETDISILEAGNPYPNGKAIWRVPRQGGSYGNPGPVCFILNTAIVNDSDFAAAVPYLSGMPVKNYLAEGFPPPIEEDE